MTQIMIGSRYWKAGDRRHVWIVDGIVTAKPGREAHANIVSESGSEAEDVDLTHLEDPGQFTPINPRLEMSQVPAAGTPTAPRGPKP